MTDDRDNPLLAMVYNKLANGALTHALGELNQLQPLVNALGEPGSVAAGRVLTRIITRSIYEIGIISSGMNGNNFQDANNLASPDDCRAGLKRIMDNCMKQALDQLFDQKGNWSESVLRERRDIAEGLERDKDAETRPNTDDPEGVAHG